MASNVTTKKPMTKDYKSDIHPDWCPGCGDFGILNVVLQTMAELELAKNEVLFYSGVGCSSKIPHYASTYGVHTLHGRSLAFSQGSQLVNPDMKVIVAGGDGDGYGIGAGHFLHAGRRNVNLTYLVFDNEVYGLTKGQASPTLGLGKQTKSLPVANVNSGINPLAIALSAGYTFVARSYAFNNKHLKQTIKRAIDHKGMAIVDILQPCPTYNNLRTKDWFAEEVEVNGAMFPRTYDVEEEEGYTGKVNNAGDESEVMTVKLKALQRVQALESRIPLGVFYEISIPTFLERVTENVPALKQSTSVKMPIADANGRPLLDLTEAYKDFRTDTY